MRNGMLTYCSILFCFWKGCWRIAASFPGSGRDAGVLQHPFFVSGRDAGVLQHPFPFLEGMLAYCSILFLFPEGMLAYCSIPSGGQKKCVKIESGYFDTLLFKCNFMPVKTASRDGFAGHCCGNSRLPSGNHRPLRLNRSHRSPAYWLRRCYS